LQRRRPPGQVIEQDLGGGAGPVIYRLAVWAERGRDVTALCAISGGPCWPGGLAGVGLPFGGAVGDQAGDGQEGLVEVFSSAEVALEGSPLLVLCVGVLDADPFR